MEQRPNEQDIADASAAAENCGMALLAMQQFNGQPSELGGLLESLHSAVSQASEDIIPAVPILSSVARAQFPHADGGSSKLSAHEALYGLAQRTLRMFQDCSSRDEFLNFLQTEWQGLHTNIQSLIDAAKLEKNDAIRKVKSK